MCIDSERLLLISCSILTSTGSRGLFPIRGADLNIDHFTDRLVTEQSKEERLTLLSC